MQKCNGNRRKKNERERERESENHGYEEARGIGSVELNCFSEV